MTRMWNLLRLPLAAAGVVLDLARALSELPRLLEALQTRLESGDAMAAEVERLDRLVHDLAEQVALLLADVRALRAQTADAAALQDQLERTQAELADANRQIGRMVETAQAKPAPPPPPPPPEPASEPVAPEEPAPRGRGRFASVFRRSSTA
jgi:outer membrane biosynthesis protein TonB